MKRLKRRVAESVAAVQALADEGYDPQFGARLLKRVIQQRLENPLAERSLKGKCPPGTTVKVDYAGKTFTFSKASGQPASCG